MYPVLILARKQHLHESFENAQIRGIGGPGAGRPPSILFPAFLKIQAPWSECLCHLFCFLTKWVNKRNIFSRVFAQERAKKMQPKNVSLNRLFHSIFWLRLKEVKQ